MGSTKTFSLVSLALECVSLRLVSIALLGENQYFNLLAELKLTVTQNQYTYS